MNLTRLTWPAQQQWVVAEAHFLGGQGGHAPWGGGRGGVALAPWVHLEPPHYLLAPAQLPF